VPTDPRDRFRESGHGVVVVEHRAMAGGEHEAVAVGPGRTHRVELQEFREQNGGDVGGTHRQAGMAGFRLLDRIHRQRADGIGHARMGDGGSGGRLRGTLLLRHGCRRRGFCTHGKGLFVRLDSM